jgi:hypothetical protein
MANIEDLAAAMNDHVITDQEGNLVEEQTTTETPATPEENAPVTESAPAEKPAEPEPNQPKGEDKESETELAEDETGKRYVPKERFDKVYGKLKATERELARNKPSFTMPAPQNPPVAPADRTQRLEAEFLFNTMPQFDPSSTEYSPELDELAGDIFRANPDLTMTQAAKRALETAKKLANMRSKVAEVARTVKVQQSDQGIAGKSSSRGETQVDPDKMTADELEEYLRRTGQW